MNRGRWRGWYGPTAEFGLPGSKRAHYFMSGRRGKSLCGKWRAPAAPQLRVTDADHDDPLNCAECKRLRARLD